MLRISLLSLFFVCSLHAFAWQQDEFVFTASAFTERAQAFLDNGEYDSALVLCDKAIEKAASYREAYIVKHKTYEAKKVKSAIKIENLMAAQKISLDDEELVYYLGKVYQTGSRFKDAIVAYTKALAYSEGNDQSFRYYYYFSRATCYVKTRKNHEAIADFTRALEIDANSASSLVNRGFCYYNIKEKEKSCKDWREAKKLGSRAAGQYISKYCF